MPATAPLGSGWKVRQLEQPILRSKPTNRSGCDSDDTDIGRHLDLATVIKVSEAVSGEIVLRS
jgi:hypothetical protein